MAGVDAVEFDEQGRLPREQIEQFQRGLSNTVGDVAHIARAVEHVVSQPIELNIEELVIRPQKSMFRTQRCVLSKYFFCDDRNALPMFFEPNVR